MRQPKQTNSQPTTARGIPTAAPRAARAGASGPSPPIRPTSIPRRWKRTFGPRSKGEVRFDDGSRALYATDASNYRQVPIGVVIPQDARGRGHDRRDLPRHGAPLLPRGGGTSLAGQCCNVAVVIDFSKYLNRVLEIDPERRLARVEPGCMLDDLRARSREARPHLRPRSRHPRPLHARRHDRQQLRAACIR